MISKKDSLNAKHLGQPRVDTYETNIMQMQDGGPVTSHDFYQSINCSPIECCGGGKDFKCNVARLKKIRYVVRRLSIETKYTFPSSLGELQ